MSYEVKSGTYTPENVFAGPFPVKTEVAAVGAAAEGVKTAFRALGIFLK